MEGATNVCAGHDCDLLVRAACEAWRWFALRPPRRSAVGRTPALRPDRDMEAITLESGAWQRADWRAIAGAVEQVVARRRAELLAVGGAAWTWGLLGARLGRGRWVLYDPEMGDFCQTACDEPGALFDKADCLGWDFWVSCVVDERTRGEFRSALVAWVPAEYVQRVQNGLALMPCCPVEWADSARVRGTLAVELLLKAGLMRRTRTMVARS